MLPLVLVTTADSGPPELGFLIAPFKEELSSCLRIKMTRSPAGAVESWALNVGFVSCKKIDRLPRMVGIKQTSQLKWARTIYLKTSTLLDKSKINPRPESDGFYPITSQAKISFSDHDLGRLAMYYLWDYWESQSVCMEARVSELKVDLKLKIKETPKNIGNTFKSIGLRPVTPKKIEAAEVKRIPTNRVKRVPPQKLRLTKKASRTKKPKQIKRLVKTR